MSTPEQMKQPDVLQLQRGCRGGTQQAGAGGGGTSSGAVQYSTVQYIARIEAAGGDGTSSGKLGNVICNLKFMFCSPSEMQSISSEKSEKVEKMRKMTLQC